ncbi:MAG TPA: M20/M25/M40 family metallo-hydrolase [Kofleriaceae bacterium]|nr:M20/M25/M40 family metallo-hydrolase [Kofleriaceae bacterium]
MRWLVVLALVARTATAAPCKDGDPFAKDALHDDVAFLASKALDGRAPGSDGDAKARAFIVERFTCLGLAPAGNDSGYEQAFTSGSAKTANLIATIEGTSDDIVMISAHHDHLGKGHLGANDDASGVAAMLAIAKAIAQGDRPTRTLVFVAFGAEEDGMVGSGFFAKHPTIALDHVVQFIELDMVGSHSSSDLVAAMGAFKGFGARTLLDKRIKQFPAIHVSAGGKARGSDFQPFCALGIPYTFFWTPDHRCYHETCDTIDRLDLRHMVDIAKLATALVRDLADTSLDLAKLRTTRGCGV